MAQVHTELSFEEAIEAHLLASGYLKTNPDRFDKELALDTEQVLAFVRQSQPKAWARLSKQHGAAVTDRFLRRLTQELDARGTLDVLRNGITDYGVRFRLAYFKPASTCPPTSRPPISRTASPSRGRSVRVSNTATPSMWSCSSTACPSPPLN